MKTSFVSLTPFVLSGMLIFQTFGALSMWDVPLVICFLTWSRSSMKDLDSVAALLRTLALSFYAPWAQLMSVRLAPAENQ